MNGPAAQSDIEIPLEKSRWPASRLRKISVLLAAIVIVLGLAVLLGWAVHIAVLKSVVPGMISMKVNTALGLILLAIAIIGLNRDSSAWRIGVQLSLLGVMLIAVLTLAEYVTGRDLHLDNVLFNDTESPRFPGRNSPGTDLAFAGLAVAFFLQHTRRRPGFAQALLLIVTTAPLITLGGYLYKAPAMMQNAPFPVIALNTSIALVLLCVAGLFARADQAVMRVIISRSLAGWLGRKLMPAAVGLPMLVGLLVLLGQDAHLYSSEFGSALLVACCAMFFGGAVVWSVLLLYRTETTAETERARLLAAERLARNEAERANRMKDEFLSVVSHELRTPLNAILGWSEVLRTGTDPADLVQGVEVIERNARAQVRIVEDILDMSRIINGKMGLDVQSVELPDVITAAVASMRPAADAKGVRVMLVLDPDAGPVSGDPNRLQQVIWNLLSNAIKFTPRGGRVSVTLQKADSQAVVSVSDNGEGISADFLPYIFERFRQEDSSSTRRFGGLGLGLSIVKHLVELHGGTVDASSAGAGLGSTFRVCLPIMKVGFEPGAGASPKTQRGMRSLSGLHVLVVDDEPDACTMVKRLLEAADATAMIAGSVEEAMLLLERSGDAMPFDVVVSDIGMPSRDGFDLIRSVRNLPASRGGRTPAIALTAYARAEDRTQALVAGFDMHVAKPVDPSELCCVVANLAVRVLKSA